MIVLQHFAYLLYLYISIFLSICSSAYIFLVFYFGRKKDKDTKSLETKKDVTILIPVYKEDKNLFERCIKTVKEQEVNFIVVGDGCDEPYKEITIKNGGRFIYLKENMGKKAALSEGIKNITSKYVMFLDSDTLLPKNAVIKLLNKFDDKTGGVGAEIRIIKDKNKLVYYSSEMLQVLRQLSFKALSHFGKVMVLNGQCSVYRTDIIKDFIQSDSFLNARFLGKKLVVGDDITLTKYVNRLGYKTKMAQDVIVLTKGQTSFDKLIKQSVRWSRSGYINFINSIKDRSLFKNGPFYTFFVLYLYTLPLLVLTEIFLRGGLLIIFILRRGIIDSGRLLIDSFIYTPRTLVNLLPLYISIKIISVLAGLLMIFLLLGKVKKNKLRFISYGSVMFLVMFFSAIYAIISINEHNKWMTR